MSQLNIHVTPEFDEKLARFMELRGINTKSEAVRIAVGEALNQAESAPKSTWEDLRALAKKYPQTPPDQWITEDELWGDDGR